jgi:hypothetical protein
MSNLPTERPTSPIEQPDYLADHAVRRQIVTDIKGFSLTQVYPSLVLTVGAFLYAWWTGQVTSFSDGLKFILYSLAAGLALYILIAIIRAPVIVVGWHLRQISGLSLKLADRLPETQGNFFSGFRVIHDGPSTLTFEFWYFYDGALGGDGICIYASLENNGVGVTRAQAYEDVSVFNHKALMKMTLTDKQIEGETSIKSTHVVLTMVRETTDTIFYRQLIPYEKVWTASQRIKGANSEAPLQN